MRPPKGAIRAGVYIVHINTDVRLAWKQRLEAGLARGEDEIVPFKILPSAVAGDTRLVSARLRLFGDGTSGVLDSRPAAPYSRFHKSMTTSRVGWEQHTRILPSAGLSSGSGS
jgi:hypothetical protein